MPCIFKHPNWAQIHLRQLFLQQHGIETQTRNQHSGLMLGMLPGLAHYPELWVSDEDASRANEALAQFDALESVEGPPWHCPTCGEANEASFEVCLQCQTNKVEAD